MPAEIERPATGPRGAFPIRLPLGKLAGVLLSLALLPAWWRIGKLTTPRLELFYASEYWASATDTFRRSPSGARPLVPYKVLAVGPATAPLLATPTTAGEAPDALYEQTIVADPKAFHAWLHDTVYHGSALKAYGVFVSGAALSFVALLLGGDAVDRRRRTSAMQGMHRRGTRFLSWTKFNRRQLGPLWLLWCLIAWRHALRSEPLLEAARRGRKFGAGWKCYQAATSLPGIVRPLRWAGVRWPRAEGPGISFRVGRIAVAAISEELLAYHLNIFGGTGRGKSTLIRELLYQIEARGETAVVHDPKREFFREFYRKERGDIVFDPKLEECPYWALEDEAADEPQGTSWASSFFPDEPRAQPFFLRHPRAIFAYLVSRYSSYHEDRNPATCAALGYWLATGPTAILPRLKGTEHYLSLSGRGDGLSDQSQGLYSTLGQVAKPLRMMPDSPAGRTRFSVKQWARERRGWIFLSSEPTTQEAILPLHSAIADMSILHTQAEVRDRDLPRVWFVLDEVATMGRIGQLESGATKQRASGNPIVLGFHDLAQLRNRYGDNGARTITAQAYTNMTLGTGDEQEALHIERTIGHEEVDQLTENRPVHILGHRARSWSNQIRDTGVVTAAQIQGLPRWQGYLVQEGRVIRFRIQDTPRRVLQEPVERVIPPLIFRDEPTVEGGDRSPADAWQGPLCAVDDEPPPPCQPNQELMFTGTGADKC